MELQNKSKSISERIKKDHLRKTLLATLNLTIYGLFVILIWLIVYLHIFLLVLLLQA